jgi:hypothetical protein
MRKVFFTLIGLIVVLAAVILLWVAHGPLAHEQRILGGVLTTQAELVQQGGQFAPGQEPALEVVTDEGQTSTTIVGAPEIGGDALTDLSSADNAESAAAPQTTSEIPPPAAAAPLTTDVVVDAATQVEVLSLDIQTAGPAPDGQGGPVAGTYEQRVIELEWPSAFRVGGAGSVRVKLKMLADGSLQPVAEIADNEVLATPILITDRYDTYTATVTATLSAPEFQVDWLSEPTQVLERGGELEWRWTLQADRSGTSVIALGLNINWQPNQGGTPLSATIWGQAVQTETNYVFGGLTVPQASLAGAVLAVVGFVSETPLLFDILKVLWRIVFPRRRRRDDRRGRR